MTEITSDEARRRIADVLKTVGIKARLCGCSWCGVFEVEFPNGDTASDCEVGYIECDGISHRRG